jgi:hypothetical protein
MTLRGLVPFVVVILPQTLHGQSSGYSDVFEAKHAFSDQEHADTFSLSVSGANLFDADVTFQIITWRGEEIYSEKFSVNHLMERDARDPRTSKDSLHILNTLQHFFDNEKFSSPAIPDTSRYAEANLIPREQWIEIWRDATTIGFSFLLGAEDGRSISFSKTVKKVVQYWACC